MQRMLPAKPNLSRPRKRPRYASLPLQEQGKPGALSSFRIQSGVCLPQPLPVCCVDFSHDVIYLAASSKEAASAFQVATGSLVTTILRPGAGHIRTLRFAADQDCLITGDEDSVTQVHNLRNGNFKHQLSWHDGPIYSVDVIVNNHFIVTGSADGNINLWREQDGAFLCSLPNKSCFTNGTTSVSISPSGELVAAAYLDSTIAVWEIESEKILHRFEGHTDVVYSVTFSPDGSTLLSGSLDSTLKIWDVNAVQRSTDYALSLQEHQGGVLSTTFSPDGRYLFSASMDRNVRIWDRRQCSSNLRVGGYSSSVLSVTHSPISRSLATGSGDPVVRTYAYCL